MRKRREAGEAAYHDESTAFPMRHVCERSSPIVGALWPLKEITIFYFFRGSKTPSKPPPRGPESTPRARERSPRTKKIKNESKGQARNAVTRGFNKPHGMALELVYRAENRC